MFSGLLVRKIVSHYPERECPTDRQQEGYDQASDHAEDAEPRGEIILHQKIDKGLNRSDYPKREKVVSTQKNHSEHVRPDADDLVGAVTEYEPCRDDNRLLWGEDS